MERHEADLPTFFEGVDEQLGSEPLARAILERWLDYVRHNQHAWLMLFRDSSGDDEIQAVRRRVSRRAREVVAGFVGQRTATPIPADQIQPTAELLVSGLAGLALSFRWRPGPLVLLFWSAEPVLSGFGWPQFHCSFPVERTSNP